MKYVYAVYDTIAKDIVGPLLRYDRDEPAIRIFTDALADQREGSLGHHAADYQLLRLCRIDEETPQIHIALEDVAAIMSGKLWLALQEKKTGA